MSPAVESDRSAAQPDAQPQSETRPVQILREGGGNLEKIRDILFGTQMRGYDARFAALEEALAKETADIRETSRRRFEQLESYVKKELELLQTRWKAERVTVGFLRMSVRYSSKVPDQFSSAYSFKFWSAATLAISAGASPAAPAVLGLESVAAIRLSPFRAETGREATADRSSDRSSVPPPLLSASSRVGSARAISRLSNG